MKHKKGCDLFHSAGRSAHRVSFWQAEQPCRPVPRPLRDAAPAHLTRLAFLKKSAIEPNPLPLELLPDPLEPEPPDDLSDRSGRSDLSGRSGRGDRGVRGEADVVSSR